jgi:HK97 family phage portal protein
MFEQMRAWFPIGSPAAPAPAGGALSAAIGNGTLSAPGPLPRIRWIDVDCHGGGAGDPVASAFAVPAFLACVRTLAEGVAQLPFRLLRTNADGSKSPATDHPLFPLIHFQPNEWQSSFEFREGMVSDVAVWGNSFAVKRFDRAGRLTALWPIEPWRVAVSQLDNRQVVYDYYAEDGSSGRYPSSAILHVRWLSRDGIAGDVPLSLLGEPLRLARTIEKHAGRFWQNHARPGMILETSQQIPREAQESLREQFQSIHAGPNNAGRTAILPNGVTLREITGASAESSQLMEMRLFIVQEIARAFKIPPSLIGENSRSTFSNAEQEQLSFVTNTLTPWCRRIEGAFRRSLLEGEPDLQVSLDVRGLLRGDSAARSAYYQALFGIGVLSPQDIRRLEDYEPIPDPAADRYYIPVNNMAALGSIAAPGAADDSPPVPLEVPEDE